MSDDARTVQILDRDGVPISFALLDTSLLSITFGGASAVLDVTAASEMRRALDLFINGRDPLSMFIATCMRSAPGKRVQATALHQVFSAWLRASGESEWTPNRLGRALHKRGYVNRTSGVNYWLDMELVKSAADFLDVGRRSDEAGVRNIAHTV